MKTLFVSLLMVAICCDRVHAEINSASTNTSAVVRRSDTARDGLIFSRRTFTTTQKEDIVKRINYHRRTTSFTASDMILVTWDTELANLAEAFAQTCTWDSTGDGIETESHSEHGSDMSILSTLHNTLADTSSLGVSSVDGWAKKADLLKEMTGSNTYEVGCGQTSCSTIDGHTSSGTITTCFFAPRAPSEGIGYTLGKSCTKCPQSYPKCHNKLCTNLEEDEAKRWNDEENTTNNPSTSTTTNNSAFGEKFTLGLVLLNFVFVVFVLFS